MTLGWRCRICGKEYDVEQVAYKPYWVLKMVGLRLRASAHVKQRHFWRWLLRVWDGGVESVGMDWEK